MSRLAALALVLCLSSLALAETGTVDLVQGNQQVLVSVDGQPFTTFHYDKKQPKPYFSPVLLGNNVVTRPLESTGSVDHPHHKGIWLSVDEVNEVKFWAEKGKIENVSVELVPAKAAGPASLKVTNHWLGADGKPLLVEKTDIKIWPNRTIVYEVKLTAADQKVTFHDTKEGLFGIRLADPLREKVGGNVVNADGKKTTKECWGQESAWVDYWGKLGEQTCGVAIFDHPKNFRKSRYHVRDYGLFTVSPFGQSAYTNGKEPAQPHVLEKGQSLQLRYGLYVHEGDTKAGHVAEAYAAFVKNEP